MIRELPTGMRNSVIVFLIVTTGAGCSAARPDDDPHDVLVEVATGRVRAPDTVPAGWARLRVEEDGEGHILVGFRLQGQTTAAEVEAFLAALDTARMTPAQAVALGGPEVGDSGEVIVELAPGRYVLACLIRGDDGHRHALQGEWHVLEATGTARGTAPPDSLVELSMIDFSYETDTLWHSGARVIRVTNNGREDHQVRMDRLHEGVTLADWIRAQGADVSEPVAGVARMSAGQTVYLPLDLIPGTYVLYCLIPAASTGALHAEMGMIRGVTVE
jgi:uncharacterized cupredoxin-like copper-binding protein